MSDITAPVQTLEVSAEEVGALSKTVGIALTNLATKAANSPPGSPQHETARKDRLTLLGFQQKLTTLSIALGAAA